MRKIAYITLIFLLLTVSWAAACVCDGSDKETMSTIFKNADFVVVGKAVTNVDFEPQFVQLMNLDQKGADVLVQVDSVLKGDIKVNEKLFIYQFGGSCTRLFQFGESYLIFGNSIKKFKEGKYTGKASKGEIPPPPPPPYVINEELEIYADNEVVKFLNKQTQKYKTITTDLCSSMYVDSDAYAETIEHLKK